MDSKSPSGTVTLPDPVDRICDVYANHVTGRNRYWSQSYLYRGLFCDIARHFPNFVSQDLDYLLGRLSQEGARFILEDLPKLGKAFETCLITHEPLQVPDGFKIRRETRLPVFLFELFNTVLSSSSGVPIYEYQNGKPSGNLDLHNYAYREKVIFAVRYIRQVCMIFSKVETYRDVDSEDALDDSKEMGNTRICAKNQKALDGFCDRLSRGWNIPQGISPVLNEARRLLRVVFSTKCDELTELCDFIANPWGRHGPGAVAGGERGSEKWSFLEWPGLPSTLFEWNKRVMVPTIKTSEQPSARACMVPKDFRGPRVICIEPKENQFAQQGLMDILYRLISRVSLTRRSISFLETAHSRKACYDYRYATIDLKDASDLISVRLARYLLPRWVFQLVTRYRSRKVTVPGKQDAIRSQCLATMGNATCFPLETLLFWAISLGTMIVLRDSFPIRVQNHLNLDIRVFGDDIIVPLWAYEGVQSSLVECGLVVNPDKSCAFTLVRESCGEWVYAGQAVKVVRLKSLDVADHRAFMQWRDCFCDLGPEMFPNLHDAGIDLLSDYAVSVRVTYPKFLKTRHHMQEQCPKRTCYQRREIYAPSFVQLGKLESLPGEAGLYAWSSSNDTKPRTPFLKGTRKRVKMSWQAVDPNWDHFLQYTWINQP